MHDLIQAMLYPFLACLLLVGIHVYLGIHVLARKVIFVDLALAQIASLGAVFGAVMGFTAENQHPYAQKIFSLLFALLGAWLLSATRSRKELIPQEAVVGIIYATAVAMMIILAANLPHGADEIRELLAGNILWVRPSDIIETAVLYVVIGTVHFIFRKKFLLVSHNPHEAREKNISVGFWDFMFYALFGMVVTSSVAIAGVLLVFSFLVIPSVVAVMLASSLRTRLLLGWVYGAVISMVGMASSYVWDLPSGPAVVVALACGLATISLVKNIFQAST